MVQGLSSSGAQSSERADSLVAASRLSWPVAHGILVPGPDVEPTSPALQGRFSTAGPPGKSTKRES